MTPHVQHDSNRRGVLVIHPGALGDVLLARPVLHALQREFSQHEIALLAGNAVGTLLRDAGEVDRVFPLESTYLSELFAGHDSLCAPFKRWLSRCDKAVGWFRDADAAVVRTLRAAGVQSINLRSSSSQECFAEHQSDRYLESVEIADAGGACNLPLILSPAVMAEAQQILSSLNWDSRSPLVVIHPGSGSPHKCVEAWRLAEVIQWLIEVGMTPMLLEGPADREPCARVLSALRTPVPVSRGLNLSKSAAVLAQAALYLGHDSGVTHLAAALAVPTVACFGPTNPRRWAPLGPTVSVVSGEPCACSTWSDVASCQERVCLQIAPERMIAACRAQLDKQP